MDPNLPVLTEPEREGPKCDSVIETEAPAAKVCALLALLAGRSVQLLASREVAADTGTSSNRGGKGSIPGTCAPARAQRRRSDHRHYRGPSLIGVAASVDPGVLRTDADVQARAAGAGEEEPLHRGGDRRTVRVRRLARSGPGDPRRGGLRPGGAHGRGAGPRRRAVPDQLLGLPQLPGGRRGVAGRQVRAELAGHQQQRLYER